VLEVSNSGPLVPDGAVDSLFTPFRRLDGTPRGHQSMGLGLSIVRAIAVAHGGTATAEPRRDGGLDVMIRIPVAE
jgi:signal transduction histidine kinase